MVAEPIGKLRVSDAVVMHLADQPSSPCFGKIHFFTPIKLF
nr:MAG TPA: hypothetical protein [Caudoviricetes sp.]